MRNATPVWIGTAVCLACLAGTARGGGADGPERHRIPPPLKIDRKTPATSSGSSGWWGGTVAVALVLAGLGAASLLARRAGAGDDGSPGASLKVLGRARLSREHVVHLVKAGDQILIIGTGPKSAPTLLGEFEPAAEPESRTATAAARTPVSGLSSAAAGFANRLVRGTGGAA